MIEMSYEFNDDSAMSSTMIEILRYETNDVPADPANDNDYDDLFFSNAELKMCASCAPRRGAHSHGAAITFWRAPSAAVRTGSRAANFSTATRTSFKDWVKTRKELTGMLTVLTGATRCCTLASGAMTGAELGAGAA